MFPLSGAEVCFGGQIKGISSWGSGPESPNPGQNQEKRLPTEQLGLIVGQGTTAPISSELPGGTRKIGLQKPPQASAGPVGGSAS